jgi:hypothetical protein
VAAPAPERELLGRDDLLEQVAGLLREGKNVALVGPRDIGKTALIGALTVPEVVVVDPFEQVHSHLAARIRRAIYRRTVHLIAVRSLERGQLGAVRRIMFWFTEVRVPPLTPYWMRQVIRHEWARAGLAPELLAPVWSRGVMRLARGRPGLAVAMVRVAAAARRAKGTIPSPDAACIEARIGQARLLTRELV